MNAKQFVSAGAIALVATACGYSIKTSTDYDRRVSFSNYQSFFFLKGNSSGDPLFDQRAKADVETALILKGWLEVPEGDGQAAVVIHTATRTKHTYLSFYDGWGGWRYDWEDGRAVSSIVEDYEVGTLVVDIFDASTKQAIWHGFASDALSGNGKSSEDATEEAINKMFKAFPPLPAVAGAQ